jgi:hypothetical protein
MERQMIFTLLYAPSYSQILDDVGTCTKDATVAGYIMLALYMMWRLPEIQGARALGGVSLNKAFHFCAYLGKERKWTYGDGSPLPGGVTKVKECWSAYKAVSHLWAAHAWLQAQDGKTKLSRSLDGLAPLLRAARHFEEFGLQEILDTKAAKRKDPVLPPNLWTVPPTYQSELKFDAKAEDYVNSPMGIALRTYVAK